MALIERCFPCFRCVRLHSFTFRACVNMFSHVCLSKNECRILNLESGLITIDSFTLVEHVVVQSIALHANTFLYHQYYNYHTSGLYAKGWDTLPYQHMHLRCVSCENIKVCEHHDNLGDTSI